MNAVRCHLEKKIKENDFKTEFNQTTIAKSASLIGVGLHTGKNVTLTFKPAPEENTWLHV